ncbi:hypothetical protein BC826DRAFT_995243 [Russula brevipes]|nr:hypothetical protein BC826DRAFT_995243 [Russula brevipes]
MSSPLMTNPGGRLQYSYGVFSKAPFFVLWSSVCYFPFRSRRCSPFPKHTLMALKW